MTDAVGAALERAAAPQDKRTVFDLIGSMETELVRSLGSPDAAAMLARHYLNAVRYNELLRQCTPESIVGALLLSSQVRLEPGPLGHVYLSPDHNSKKGVYEVRWMLGYTGIIVLGRRGGAVGLRAAVVWDCDEYTEPWENEKGLHWTLKPGPTEDREERVGVLVTWKDGTERNGFHCPPSEIDRALKASARKDTSRREEDWYWRKTGVRRARPWLPLSTDLAVAVQADDGVVRGVESVEAEARPVLAPPEVEGEPA
jgi:recombination protein RecT